MATITGTLLALLVALVQGVSPAAIYAWLVVLPVLLAVGMGFVAAVAAVVIRLLR